VRLKASASEPAVTTVPEFARLAARVREIRTEHDQTLDELAVLCGLSKTYLSRMESGERQPSLAALVALARAWNLPLSSLFKDTAPRKVARVQREASVEWEGDADGDGYIRVGSGNIEGPYSQKMRRAGKGINPEELIGAAQAGCYTMKLASLLTSEGFPPKSIHTSVSVHGEFSDTGFKIARLDLTAEAEVDGLSPAALRDLAARAHRQCPVSQALAGVDISVRADLRQS
jgi:osmotically inducible protein OsmC